MYIISMLLFASVFPEARRHAHHRSVRVLGYFIKGFSFIIIFFTRNSLQRVRCVCARE